MKIQSQKDFFSGLMFMCVGVAFAWGSATYKIGTFAWKPLFFIIAANLVFDASIGGLPIIGLPPMGLIVGICLLTYIAAHAGDGFKFKEGLGSLLMILGLIGAVVLTDGIGFIVIAMGVFGYGEIISNLSKHECEREVFSASVSGLMPSRDDFRNMVPAVLRGTALGSLLGILPGGGAVMAAFAASPQRRDGADGRCHDHPQHPARPLSASLLVAAAILLAVVLMPSIKAKRDEAFVED